MLRALFGAAAVAATLLPSTAGMGAVSPDRSADTPRAATVTALEEYRKRTRYQLTLILRLSVAKDYPGALDLYRELVDGGRSIDDIELSSNTGELDEFAVIVGRDVSPVDFRAFVALALRYGQVNRIRVIDDVTWEGGMPRLSVPRRTLGIAGALRTDRPLTSDAVRSLLNESLSDEAFWALADPADDDSDERAFVHAQSIIDRDDHTRLLRAEQILQGLIDRNPRAARNYVELARARMKAARGASEFKAALARADDSLNQAMKYESQNADVHVLLGYVRVEQGRLDEAIEVLRRARDLGATSRWLDYNWGLAHERRFEDRQAADRFQRAVDYRLEGQLDRNRFAVIASYRRLILALIRLRDFDRADQVFRQRLNALADVEEAALGLCEDWYLQFRLQHFGDLHFGQQAIDTMREHECFVRANLVAMAQLLKSGVLSRQGDGEEAAQWLDRARFSIEYPGEFLYLVAQGQATSASLGAIRRELLSLDPQTQADEAAVRMAVAERDAFALTQLIKAGVPADRPVDPVGATALMLAAWSGDVSLAKALVAAGASISDRDLSGRTALDYARAAGSSSMVKFLSGLAQGA